MRRRKGRTGGEEGLGKEKRRMGGKVERVCVEMSRVKSKNGVGELRKRGVRGEKQEHERIYK